MRSSKALENSKPHLQRAWSMNTWIFVRHGESVANAEKYLSGWENISLTSKGRSEALALKNTLETMLHKIELELGKKPRVELISSDLQRAVETGQIATGGANIFQDKRFRERCFGAHQGKPKHILRESGIMEQLLSWNCDDPQIESFQQLANRVFPAMDEYSSEVTVLFAHGGVIRMILGLLEKKSLHETARWSIPNAVPYIRKKPLR